MVTGVTAPWGLPLTVDSPVFKVPRGGRMKDIHEVLRRKQAKYAQLGKQIELLQQAAEKLREVAPLLADMEEDDSAILADVDDVASQANSMSAKAGAASGSNTAPAAKGARPAAPRWP